MDIAGLSVGFKVDGVSVVGDIGCFKVDVNGALLGCIVGCGVGNSVGDKVGLSVGSDVGDNDG